MKRRIALALAMLLALAPAALAGGSGCNYYDEHGDHNWQQIDFQYATCTSEGYVVVRCQECGVQFTEWKGLADHEWVATGAMDPSTCVYNGWREERCVNCGAERDVTLPLADHKWVSTGAGQAATCISKGWTVERCSVCDMERSHETGYGDHQFSDWVVTLQATDHSKGERRRSCTVCGTQQTEAFYPDGTLYRNGPKGSDVRQLQQTLIDMGFLNDTADGVFGKRTEQAVRDFQSAQSLTSDGIAWPQTLSALSGAYRAGNEVITAPVSDGDYAQYCVPWSEDAGIEFITGCGIHGVLFDNEAALGGLSADALVALTEEWQSALDALTTQWAQANPAAASSIYGAEQALLDQLDADAVAMAAMGSEAVAMHRLRSLQFECTRLCDQLNLVGD